MANGSPGRPYIGQKVQAHIPDQQAEWIEKEAVERGVPGAEVVREIIDIGFGVLLPALAVGPQE